MIIRLNTELMEEKRKFIVDMIRMNNTSLNECSINGALNLIEYYSKMWDKAFELSKTQETVHDE